MTHLADRTLALSPLNGVKGRRKVAIIGAGLGFKEAPLDDPEWDIWTCNLVAPLDSAGRLRADRWFDIHQREAQSADDLRWIGSCPVPIYLPPDLLDAGRTPMVYPLAAIEAEFGVSYWACTFAYQIALVLYENARAARPAARPWTDLGLYGVELAVGDERERTVEWANTSYWLGQAEARGLRLHRPEWSMLGRHLARYGFEYAKEAGLVKDYVAGELFKYAEED